MWVTVNFDVLEKIMLSGLKTRDVIRCLQVCKSWKMQLSHEHFWKKYLLQNFDIAVENDKENLESPLHEWANKHIWNCYFKKDYKEEDVFVMKPFPSMWKCGVVVPHALDPLLLDTRRLQGLCRSLDILLYMKEGVVEFGLQCGNEYSGNEGCNTLSTVLMPWDGTEALPDKLTVFSQIFQFHREIWEEQLDCYNTKFEEKALFHLDKSSDDDESDCLNEVFGRPSEFFWRDKTYDYNKELAFFTWLQNIMVPSNIYIAGENRMNPVAEFFITPLAPGWVGGILTGQCWT